MTSTPPAIRLAQFTFSLGDWHSLPETEQRFFVRLALVSDDLRHLRHLILQSVVAMRSGAGIENRLGLHQLMFALRIYYGTLNESWEVIRTGWHGSQLSLALHETLSDEAKEALGELKRYFSHDNLTTRIRNNLAFHFSDEPIREALEYRSGDESASFVSGEDLANIFYSFAEDIRYRAMLRKTGDVDMNDQGQITLAIRTLYDEGFWVADQVTTFSNAVMVTIAKRLNAKVEYFNPSYVTDLSKTAPLLFIDPESILRIEKPVGGDRG
jgi:hypothetical protein